MAYNEDKRLVAVSSATSTHAYIDVYRMKGKILKFLDEYSLEVPELKIDPKTPKTSNKIKLQFKNLIFTQSIPETLEQFQKKFKENQNSKSIVSDKTQAKNSKLSLLVASTNIGGYFMTLCFSKNKESGYVEMMTCTKPKKILD